MLHNLTKKHKRIIWGHYLPNPGAPVSLLKGTVSGYCSLKWMVQNIRVHLTTQSIHHTLCPFPLNGSNMATWTGSHSFNSETSFLLRQGRVFRGTSIVSSAALGRGASQDRSTQLTSHFIPFQFPMVPWSCGDFRLPKCLFPNTIVANYYLNRKLV